MKNLNNILKKSCTFLFLGGPRKYYTNFGVGPHVFHLISAILTSFGFSHSKYSSFVYFSRSAAYIASIIAHNNGAVPRPPTSAGNWPSTAKSEHRTFRTTGFTHWPRKSPSRLKKTPFACKPSLPRCCDAADASINDNEK